LYGSRAKGNYRQGSDIDITLVGSQVTNHIVTKVWLDIDDLNTPYLFDISVYHFNCCYAGSLKSRRDAIIIVKDIPISSTLKG
jgi:predicted nucleotidyltransferase